MWNTIYTITHLFQILWNSFLQLHSIFTFNIEWRFIKKRYYHLWSSVCKKFTTTHFYYAIFVRVRNEKMTKALCLSPLYTTFCFVQCSLSKFYMFSIWSTVFKSFTKLICSHSEDKYYPIMRAGILYGQITWNKWRVISLDFHYTYVLKCKI